MRASSAAIDATYDLPFLAHVAMEPGHYLADVRADRAELWGSTQVPENVADRAREITALPASALLAPEIVGQQRDIFATLP